MSRKSDLDIAIERMDVKCEQLTHMTDRVSRKHLRSLTALCEKVSIEYYKEKNEVVSESDGNGSRE
jgi:hypothetical protein